MNRKPVHNTNIGKRGDSGCIKLPVFVSAFSTADTNELRNPRLPILAIRYGIFKNNIKNNVLQIQLMTDYNK